ncbi:hypothetical protein DERP_004874 [Dermatophagoides pteronyssinus]|uniref:Uncharacterized protein n=1 Tax=Dermatophagoides pteronyssinus TaxID=6956 RepID=A0ABQ8JTC3_DERPT|nr:hypothetical protein DERP_004874 [Dermatophagoides pteronyssinus]
MPCIDSILNLPFRYSAYAREVGNPKPNPCIGEACIEESFIIFSRIPRSNRESVRLAVVK